MRAPILSLAVMAQAFFNWTFAGAPVSVELELGVLERLKREILRRGDQEESGILLGSSTVDSPIRVRIRGFRPAAKEAVATALKECRASGSLLPVGYYRLGGRAPISLRKDEVVVASICFQDP